MASFVIPAGTVIDEFVFSAEGSATAPAGTRVAVEIVDVSHPTRDQAELCPGNHPLDGCATVDYGAFGPTHDNHIIYEGPDGPAEIHLYKDRSLQPDPELSSRANETTSPWASWPSPGRAPNIDANAPDGLTGDTEVEVTLVSR